ncbi:MAG: hypothetical protein ABIH00_06130 [Armatimonadota bacterium]
MNHEAELKKAYNTTVVIGIAFIVSFAVYIVIANLISMGIGPFSEIKLPITTDTKAVMIIRTALFVAALAGAVVLKFLRESMLKKKEGESFNALVNKLRTTALITYAFCESFIIYGFIVYLFTLTMRDLYAFLFYSICVMVIFFPRFIQWKEYTGIIKQDSIIS